MLREWLAGRASAASAAARGLLQAWRRLRGSLDSRELADLVSDESLAEILLGGFDPGSSEPYRPGSLARLYRDLYGVEIVSPRLVAARLRDGLSLRLAGRGVQVRVGETRFTALVEAVAEAADRLLSLLGVEPPEPLGFDPTEPLWGLEAARRLAEELLRLLPPYSREALILFSASSPAPLGVVEALGGSWEELRSLGLEEAARLPGADDPEAAAPRMRILTRAGGALEAYRCLALSSMRLLQLDELRAYIEAPDPLEELARDAAREAPGAPARAASPAGEALPLPRGCPAREPPRLPPGYAVVEAQLLVEDVAVKLPGGEELGTYMDLVEALLPLLYRGLAGLEPLGAEEGRLRLRCWFVAASRGR